MYINRNISNKVLRLLHHFPVVCIVGPRQVGKTTLAKELTKQIPRTCIYLDLELPEDLNKFQDPQIYLEQHEEKCVIIDEIQRIPDLFSTLRALIDRKREPGRFLILGSASPELLKQSSESLAGRIVYIELAPFNFTEINSQYQMTDHWFRGGFPEAFLSRSNEIYTIWIRNFIQTYLEKDMALLGLSADPVLMRRLWSMIAHYNGGIWNASTFARSLGLTVPTINRYINFLEAAFLVHRLEPYYFNIKKRMVKSPKIYIRDTGILHYMAGINTLESLHGQALIGSSWEGYAIEQIRQLLPDEIQLFFYRTHHGAEADLVLVQGTKPGICIEIKYTSQPKLSRGFRVAMDDLQTGLNYIITPKSETYSISNSVKVCNLQSFLTQHLNQILT